MKIKFNGYYWTILDIITALLVIVFLLYVFFTVLNDEGISVATVAGAIWGVGILGFMFLYQLPIFGNSIKAQELLDEGKEEYTPEEVKIIFEDRRHKKIEPKVLKRSILFFCISGGITLVGIFTNT